MAPAFRGETSQGYAERAPRLRPHPPARLRRLPETLKCVPPLKAPPPPAFGVPEAFRLYPPPAFQKTEPEQHA